jgi:xanthine dehydrogenase accessory factor
MADVPFPRGAAPEDALREALDALDAGRSVVLATVIARHGSAPSTPGQKLALIGGAAGTRDDRAHAGGATGGAARPDGAHGDDARGQATRAVGTVGGGAVEHAVLRAMLAALDAPDAAPRTETFRLGPNLGMCCGGSATILLEPLRPSIAVLVVGAGHVGTETAPLLARLGFRVTLVDARDEAAGEGRGGPLPGALRVVHADHDDPEVLAALGGPPERSFCVVMTHDHQLDQAVVEWALARRFAFVGGVGSRAKAARTRERLRAKGAPEVDVARVRMPVGIDIGARRPAEIAVAIASELVRVRAEREGLARHVREAAE